MKGVTIKIGGQKCKLENMPESLRNKIEEGMYEEGMSLGNESGEIKFGKSSVKGKRDERRCLSDNDNKLKSESDSNISMFRKMFGYKNGIDLNKRTVKARVRI